MRALAAPRRLRRQLAKRSQATGRIGNSRRPATAVSPTGPFAYAASEEATQIPSSGVATANATTMAFSATTSAPRASPPGESALFDCGIRVGLELKRAALFVTDARRPFERVSRLATPHGLTADVGFRPTSSPKPKVNTPAAREVNTGSHFRADQHGLLERMQVSLARCVICTTVVLVSCGPPHGQAPASG